MAVQLGRLEVETPDHVVLRYDLAGGGNRGFAAVVDFLIATLVVIGAIFAFETANEWVGGSAVQFFGVSVLLTFGIAWAYFILLEWLWQGQTVGKRLFGLRVIRDDGAPAGFVAVLIRNLVRIIDFLPGFYGLGLLFIIVTSRSQRLGDIAAGTYVVRAPRPQLDYFSLRTMTPLAAGASIETRALPGEAQRLVREFVAREAKLRPA
ncbi:MAG: RDD family protein, partial [Chloroflexota bacterium]